MAVRNIALQPGPSDGKDTYIDSSNPANNYGTQTNLLAHSSGSVARYQTYLKFDVDTVTFDPSTEVIDNPGLALTLQSAVGNEFWLYPVTSSWDKSTLVWNNRSTLDAHVDESASLNNPLLFNGVGLQQLIDDWLRGNRPNHGVAVFADRNDGGSNSTATIRSSRYATASERPKLTFRIRLAPTATPSSPAGSEGSPAPVSGTVEPRLEWAYSSPDAGDQQRYQVRIFDADNSLVYTTAQVTSANKYHDVPAEAGLQFGEVYHWQVRVYDGAWGPWSTSDAYFRPTLPAPTDLTATPSPENATISLEWTGSGAAAGYNVYRKDVATGDYRKINLALLSAPEYVDDTAACGVIYDYAVTAVAETGYESEFSDPVETSVIFAGTFIDDLRLEHEPTVFHPEIPFVGSSTPVLGRREPTVFRRQSSRTLRLEGICTSRAELQAIVSRLAAPGNHRYVDAMGEVMRFEVTSAISFPQHRPYDPQNPVYFWSVTVTEVA